jgi:hypothetical protein
MSRRPTCFLTIPTARSRDKCELRRVAGGFGRPSLGRAEVLYVIADQGQELPRV